MISNNANSNLTIVLPSDGVLYDGTKDFLERCDLSFMRASNRRYVGSIPNLTNSTVLFQRAGDVVSKIEDGGAELGITGLDRFTETVKGNGDAIVLIDDLGYGSCDLVPAVPSGWLDVVTISDLAEVSFDFKQTGRQMRIATKYPRMVSKYLISNGIEHFSLVNIAGTVEVAPSSGYADLIVDLVVSGETLRENGLRALDGPSILSSQACLIGNKELIGSSDFVLSQVKKVLETMEAYLYADSYYEIVASTEGISEKEIIGSLEEKLGSQKLKYSVASQVYNSDEKQRFNISIIIKKSELVDMVEYLRTINVGNIITSPVRYIFGRTCASYQAMLSKLSL